MTSALIIAALVGVLYAIGATWRRSGAILGGSSIRCAAQGCAAAMSPEGLMRWGFRPDGPWILLCVDHFHLMTEQRADAAEGDLARALSLMRLHDQR